MKTKTHTSNVIANAPPNGERVLAVTTHDGVEWQLYVLEKPNTRSSERYVQMKLLACGHPLKANYWLTWDGEFRRFVRNRDAAILQANAVWVHTHLVQQLTAAMP